MELVGIKDVFRIYSVNKLKVYLLSPAQLQAIVGRLTRDSLSFKSVGPPPLGGHSLEINLARPLSCPRTNPSRLYERGAITFF